MLKQDQCGLAELLLKDHGDKSSYKSSPSTFGYLKNCCGYVLLGQL